MTSLPPLPPAAHAEHDPLLVARLAGDDVTPAERAVAEAQVAACPDCARLRDDLLALGRSLAQDLPAPHRPRDFRIGARAAPVRLGRWQRLQGSWSGLLSPLAGGAAALGLALLLVSGGIAGLAPSSAAAPAPLSPVSAPGVGVAGGGSPEVRSEAIPSASSASATDAGAPAAGESVPAASSSSTAPSASSGKGVTGTLLPASSASPTSIAFSADGRSGAPSPSPLIGTAGATAPSSASPASAGPIVVALGWILLVGGLTVLLVRWSSRRRRTS